MASTSASLAEAAPTFPVVISRLFRAWTAYQYALRAQMGGSTTAQKAIWFESVLADLFASNRNLQMDEVIDWIDELVFNEFDLIVEDGSIEWLADALVKCFGWLRNDRHAEVSALLARLPSDSAVTAATAQSKTTADADDESDSGDDDRDQTAAASSSVVGTTSSSANSTSNGLSAATVRSQEIHEPMDESESPVDDGWTTVTKKGKKK